MKGFDVTVFTSDIETLNPVTKVPPGETQVNSIPVRRFHTLLPPNGYSKSKNLGFFGQLLNKGETLTKNGRLFTTVRTFAWHPVMPEAVVSLITSDVDLIHAACLPWSTVHMGYLASRSRKVPFIVTPFFHVNHPYFELPSNYFVLRNCDGLIVPTAYEKSALIHRGVSASRITVTGLGVDTDLYRKAEPGRFRKEFSIGPDNRIVAFSGRPTYNKGYHHLLLAMQRVWSQEKDVFLLREGPRDFVEGSLSSYERGIVESALKVRDANSSRILDVFLKDRQLRINALSAADVIVLPSKVESFGLVYLEAWALMKPVIGASYGTTPSVVDDHDNGLLVGFGNVEQLSDSILRVIRNPSLGYRLGRQGYAKLSEHYTWDNVIERISSIYENALA